jgi:hypothetical protein
MENKDHLNQIPGENLDEKTSNLKNQDVEASQQTDNQTEAEPQTAQSNETVNNDNVSESAQEEVSETIHNNIESPETTPSEVTDQNELTDPKTDSEKEETAEIASENPKEATEADILENEPVKDEEQPEEMIIAESSQEENNQPAEAIETNDEEATTAREETKAEADQQVFATADTDESTNKSQINQPETASSNAELEAEEQVPETDEQKSSEEASEIKIVEEEIQPEVIDENPDEDESDEDEEHEEEAENDFSVMNRRELVEKLEEYIAEDDINKVKSKVALIKLAYLKKYKEEKEEKFNAGLSKPHEEEESDANEALVEDTTEIRFNELFDIYKQKRSIFLENLEKEKVENLQKKQAILEELKSLISSEETLKKTYDDFKSLQDRWKDIGMVPKSEVNNLWQNYHFLVEKFFDKVKINKELKDLDLRKNLEQKIELCEKAEELLLEKSIIKSFKELQRLHDLWKEIGPVPSDKNDDIWERFKSATDKINQRRRDHYNQLQAEHEQNLASKNALCESAEQLLATEANTLKEWQAKTNQFNELFKVWKTIGPASKKQNDEIWERFRNAMDSFFNEKKEYFGKLKEQQINNYNIKLDLCVRAEALKDSADWRETTKEMINLQQEWKEIGPVPRKHSDKIWKRFRAACDAFFNNKSNHFSNIRKEENDNLKKREELIKLVNETAFDGNKSENLNKLKEFQRQWTEIGFVPFKEKDRLQSEFRNAVNKRLDALNISNTEISLANYKSKIEVVKESPEGMKSLSRERSFIQNKINQLRDDINVWENNIGFLANSKNANVFKSEFEKKINAAKEELKTLEAKLKLIND